MSCSVSSYLSFYNLFFFWPLPLITKEQIAQGKINFIQSCIVLMKTGSNTKINKLGMCIGHQIKPVNIPFVFLWCSLFFIWSTFTFCMVNFSLNKINFYFLYGQVEFLYGQLFTFYMVKLSFYMVNFLLFISVSVKADCRFQTADCRLGVKCKPRVKCRLKTARGKRQTRFKNNPLPQKNFKSDLGLRLRELWEADNNHHGD